MKLDKIRHTYIHERVVHRIEEMILQEEFKPGDRLPPERELAKLLGVSRSALRQALAVLREKDLIEVRVGDGTYARYRPPVSVVAPLAEILTKERHAIIDPLEVRYLLEPQIARLAAERAKEQDVEELEQLLTSHKNQLKNEEYLPIELDTAFHLRIARATGNSMLVDVLEATFKNVEQSRFMSLSRKDSLELSLQGHQKVVEGIRQKNADMAYDAMHQHLDTIKKLLVSNYLHS